MKKFILKKKITLFLLGVLVIGAGLSRFVFAVSNVSTISSSVYTISDDGAGNGSIRNVPTGTSKADFLANIIKNEPNETFDDSMMVDPIDSNGYGSNILTVIAEDGVTITYYALYGNTVATISSSAYIVSTQGYGNETIIKVPNGTSKADFLANLTKDEPNEIWDDTGINDPVAIRDILIVRSQDGNTQISYEIAQSDITTISSSVYDISNIFDGAYGFYPIRDVQPETSKADFLANLIKDDPDETFDDSSLQDPVQLNDKLTVIAEDGRTSRVYGIRASDIATISSSVYNVSSDGISKGAITNVPIGVSKADFLANLTKDEPNEIWDDTGLDDPVQNGNVFISRSQSGTGNFQYLISTQVVGPAPEASSVAISGTPTVGQTLTGNYDYYNDEVKTWVRIGDEMPLNVNENNIAIDKNGVIFVSFFDIDYDSKLSVYKYDSREINPTWQPVGDRGFSLATNYRNNDSYLAVDTNGVLYVSYIDFNYNITVMKYDYSLPNSIWEVVGTESFVQAVSDFLPIVIDNNGVVYILFDEPISGSRGAPTVMKYDPLLLNPIWTVVGNNAFSELGVGGELSIELDNNGIPYVGFEDFDPAWTPSKTSIMKYDPNSNTWIYVGDRGGASPDEIGELDLAFDRTTNTPYVLIQDWRDGGSDDPRTQSATVFKFNGTTWETVGIPRFSPNNARYPDLEIDSTGIMYISFIGCYSSCDNNDSKFRPMVMRYNPYDTSPAWEMLERFSIDGFASTHIVLDSHDELYVTVSDTNFNKTLNVKKYAEIPGDNEGQSQFQWYRDNVIINGATARTYIATGADVGRTITFEVTPVTAVGSLQGNPIRSDGVVIQDIPVSSGGSSVGSILNGHNSNSSKLLGGGMVCVPSQIITQNLRASARDGKYNSYTKGIVKEVRILQAHMNRLGFGSGKEDGILGPKSTAAIKKMQKFLNTKQDGYIGPITRDLINNSCELKKS